MRPTRCLSTTPSTDPEDDEPPSAACALSHEAAARQGPLVVVGGLGAATSLRPRTPRRIRTRAERLRRTHYRGVSDAQWNDWRWQLSNRVTRLEQLDRMLVLSPEERQVFQEGGALLPVAVTPYYMTLLDACDPAQPLRRAAIPTVAELTRGPGEADDPLGEEGQSPVPGLIHRYPDRALLLVHDQCAMYCRYCTRSRVAGHGPIHAGRASLQRAIDYIRDTPSIRDVLCSGGDPLTMSDDRLEWLLSSLRAIPHVEMIRIGTKVPAVLPQRVTPQLVRMLKRYHPLWMSLHFTHPDELTPQARRACERLADAGIPLGSQTVLLRGVNDDVETMRGLVHGLLKVRVRPYYLYQCDPITGSAPFRTTIEKGLEIIAGLRGHTTGYAVPTYVIDAPGGGGKIPLMPDYVAGRDGDDVLLRNHEGRLFCYPDGFAGADPSAGPGGA